MAYPSYERKVTGSRLEELFSYDAEAGRLVRLSSNKWAKPKSHGYVYVAIDGVTYPEHHLVWIWFTGQFPPTGQTIDHKYRIKHHNSFDNLRLATQGENQANTKVRSDNALGLRGVYFHKTERKYRATAWKDGKCYSCGQFNTAEEAHEVAEKKRKELHGDFVLQPALISLTKR